jgi:hypothetical protein
MQPPQPAKIYISFDHNLRRITGKESDVAMVSNGISFIQFLFFLFESYPEIQASYPPGKLGFLINNEAPREDSQLYDGDRVLFVATGEDGVTRTP